MSEIVSPYPLELRAAPGNELSKLGTAALVKLYGPRLVLACRLPEELVYLIVPTAIADMEACSRSLVLASPAKLTAIGSFEEPGHSVYDYSELLNEAVVLVCAPPLSGARAFQLAEIAWRESMILEQTVAELDTLDAVAAWSPARAKTTTRELFVRLEEESRAWLGSTRRTKISHPKGHWLIYAGAAEMSLADALTNLIQKYARAPVEVRHRALPAADQRLAEGLVTIAALGRIHDDNATELRAYKALLTHPSAVLAAIPFAENLKYPIQGLDACAMSALDQIFCEELLALAPRTKSRRSQAPTYAVQRPQTMRPGTQPETQPQPGTQPVPRVGLASPFTFTLAAAHKYALYLLDRPTALHSPEVALENLETFMGGYLGDLDLSRSIVTGSAAMSSVHRTVRSDMFGSHADYLSSLYPATYTVMEPEVARRAQRLVSAHDWRAGAPLPFVLEDAAAPRLSHEDTAAPHDSKLRRFRVMVWYPGTADEVRLPYEEVAGVDIDIAIAAEGEDFDRIAAEHFAAIQRRFPSAVLERVDREKSHMYRVVSAVPPGLEKGFREVEMYPATWAEVCTHHVGMVRLGFTGAGAGVEGKPLRQFYLTASCLLSAVKGHSPNYYYFASKKTPPQEVLLKYAVRGFPISGLPAGIRAAVAEYAQQSPKWNPIGQSFNRYDLREVYNAAPARDCVGRYNVEAIAAETRAYGHERPPPE